MDSHNDIFSKNLADLTPPERIDYARKMTLEVIKNQFHGMYFNTPELREFHKKLMETMDGIKKAEYFEEIDTALTILKMACEQWKGEWLETSLTEHLKDIGWQIDKLSMKLYNFDFYIRYGIITHPKEQKANDPAAKTRYTKFPQGLSPELIRQIQNNPNYYLVYVSGSEANPWGHALLFMGDAGFIHIDRPYAHPKHMTIKQFNAYLAAENKYVIGMQKLNVESSNDAILKIDELCRKPWKWFGVKHNCVTFCEEIAEAGKFPIANVRKHSLKLPTNILSSATHESQILSETVQLVHVGKFAPEIFQQYNILSIDVMENFTQEDTIKFVNYVLNNMRAVLYDQAKIIEQLPRTVKMEAMEFEMMQSSFSPLEQAAKNIQAKLKEIQNKMQGSHAKLFSRNFVKIAMSPELPRAASLIKKSVDEIQFLNSQKHKLFPHPTSATQSTGVIQEDDLNVRPKK